MRESMCASLSAVRGARLLDRAIGFALTSVQAVTPRTLAHRTPCASWDLTMLLLHLGDSLGALHEGMSLGRVGTEPEREPVEDPVSALRVRAVRVLRASAAQGTVTVGDRSLAGELMTGAGAIEVAVHGWDISQATGERRPVPPALAGDLLRICPLVVPGSRRGPLFAEPVVPAPEAGAGERLVAFLGRRPLA